MVWDILRSRSTHTRWGRGQGHFCDQRQDEPQKMRLVNIINPDPSKQKCRWVLDSSQFSRPILLVYQMIMKNPLSLLVKATAVTG